MTEYCEGCRTLITGCVYKQHNITGECPCTACIIKPMCKTGCPDYFIFKDTNPMNSY
jgi:hypothetical protein